MSAPHQLDQRARSGFRQAFGYAPGAVAVAPGRMNIIGEHTDYNEGFVLPAAIDRLPGRRIGSWGDYLIGVAREIDRRHEPGPGFDAFVASDLPVGSGLSSSGALDVATAVAMLAARGIEMPLLEIARLCQSAENV